MPTPVKQPEPPPPPPPPPAPPPEPVHVRAAKDIAHAKTGPDATRPIRYAIAFAKGSIMDGLNGMAGMGRKWSLVGLGLGIIAGIAAPVTLGLVAGAMGGALIGIAGGAGIGLAKGVLTGGPKAVGRLHRSEVYAEDLIVRKNVQGHAAPNHNDFRQAYAAEQMQRQAVFARQIIERNNENSRDFHHYWEDRERERRHHQQMQQQGPEY